MKQPTIRFLIPYFGRWPAWMPFFVETVRWNPKIDWFFYTDCGPIPNCPPNIWLKPISFSQYCEHVSNTLKIDFKPSSPYKLCDLKPSYGHIHQEDLKDLDFWAFGDIDVVLGDLRAYFTDERLSRKDVFSTHSRRISGHMCLMRNQPEINQLFMKIPDWERLFEKDEHLALDEGAFTRVFLRYKNLPRAISDFCGFLTNPSFRRAEFVEAFSTPNAKIPWTDGSKNFPRVWTWECGRLTNDKNGVRNFPYFHFFSWKRLWVDTSISETAKLLAISGNGFSVNREGFAFP